MELLLKSVLNQGEDPDGGRQGRIGAGAQGDARQGRRGSQARDRGGHCAHHEGAQAHGCAYYILCAIIRQITYLFIYFPAQLASVGRDVAAEVALLALARVYQEAY